MLKICAFHAAMCDEASPGGFDAAVEEVRLWLPLHDICQDQPDCGCSPHPTDTRGTQNIHFVIKRHFFGFIPGPNFSHCHQNQTYELYAVVNHSGDLRSGHYTVAIRDDENWFNFNDSSVTLVRLTPMLLKGTIPLITLGKTDFIILLYITFYILFSVINRLMTSHSRTLTITSKF